MRLFGSLVAWLCILASAARAQNEAAPAGEAAPALDAKTANSIGSYGIGMNIGRNIQADGLEVDLESLVRGMRDGLQGAQSRYTDGQIRAALGMLQRDVQAKRAQRDQSAGGKNKQEGQAFLAANKSKPGVVALPSGLQYQVIRSGNGASPKATDEVTVHYEGTLIDGTVFDSSIKRKSPATFAVNGVIAGWTEALQLMKVGDKWRVFIPSELAYGARGAGRVIGPNAVLIFDVELLGIGGK